MKGVIASKNNIPFFETNENGLAMLANDAPWKSCQLDTDILIAFLTSAYNLSPQGIKIQTYKEPDSNIGNFAVPNYLLITSSKVSCFRPYINHILIQLSASQKHSILEFSKHIVRIAQSSLGYFHFTIKDMEHDVFMPMFSFRTYKMS